MRGPVWDVYNGSREEVIALVVEHHKTFAAFDVNRFLAVQVFAGVPADRDLRPHQTTAASRKTQLRGDHQSRLMVLARPHPLEILAPHYARRVVDNFFILLGSLQPLSIEITHRSSKF